MRIIVSIISSIISSLSFNSIPPVRASACDCDVVCQERQIRRLARSRFEDVRGEERKILYSARARERGQKIIQALGKIYTHSRAVRNRGNLHVHIFVSVSDRAGAAHSRRSERENRAK